MARDVRGVWRRRGPLCGKSFAIPRVEKNLRIPVVYVVNGKRGLERRCVGAVDGQAFERPWGSSTG